MASKKGGKHIGGRCCWRALVAPGNFGENRHFGEKRHANGGYWFHMAYELREYWFRWL